MHIVRALELFIVALIAVVCCITSLWAAADAQGITRLSGIVADASGAAIAGATVQLRSANGTVQITTKSDTYGSFLISGLSAGNYRLVVSSPGFETKEIPVTIRTTEEPAPLHISLAVGSVSATIKVPGREDTPVGLADSATQGTVGAAEIQDRPILRSGEILETVPGVIITQHAGGGKANQYFLRGFNLDHGTDFAIFIDDMPLNLPSHAHGEGYADMNTVIPPENDGHPPPLEVDRHLVDLLEPLLDLEAALELDMLQDRDVEQVLEAGLVETVQIGVFEDAVGIAAPDIEGGA